MELGGPQQPSAREQLEEANRNSYIAEIALTWQSPMHKRLGRHRQSGGRGVYLPPPNKTQTRQSRTPHKAGLEGQPFEPPNSPPELGTRSENIRPSHARELPDFKERLTLKGVAVLDTQRDQAKLKCLIFSAEGNAD